MRDLSSDIFSLLLFLLQAHRHRNDGACSVLFLEIYPSWHYLLRIVSANRCVFVCVLCWQLLPMTDEQELDAVTTPLVCYCVVWSLQRNEWWTELITEDWRQLYVENVGFLCSGRKWWCVFSFYLTTCQIQTHTQNVFLFHLRVRKVEKWTKMDGLIFHSSFILLWSFILHSYCKS